MGNSTISKITSMNSSNAKQLNSSNERLQLSKSFMFDKDKIMSKSVESIINNEIEYYRCLIGFHRDQSAYDWNCGLLNTSLLLYNYMSLSQVPGTQFSTDKKQKFIETYLPQMILEYNEFMLKLSKKFKNTTNFKQLNNFLDSLVPLSISIQLLWRCHLLHPDKYYKDCIKYFGFLLSPHTSKGNVITKSVVDFIKGQRDVIAMLTLRDKPPDLDFIMSPKYSKFKKSFSSKNKNKKFTDLNFNITVIKQLEFMSKTSCNVWKSNFTDNLEGFSSRYIKYLKCGGELIRNKRNNNKNSNIKSYEYDSLSPTYNIDLLWHTHMIYPSLYRKECWNITNGILLDHDDISVMNVVDDNNKNKKEDSFAYWKYGKLGQFNRTHYVSLVIKERAKIIVNGYVRNLNKIIPKEIVNILFENYFNPEIELKELSPTPPAVNYIGAQCKGAPAECCIGDHMKLG